MKKETIYHYCSEDVFNLIIENKTIRMTDINYMNDYMEKEWTKKFAFELLDEVLVSEGITIDLDTEYYYSEEINSHREYFETEIKNIIDLYKLIFIACFSKDGDKLSQWRAYAEDGSGVSVGFNKKILNKLVNRREIQPFFSLEEIVYSEKKQRKILSDIIIRGVQRTKLFYEEIAIYNDFLEFFQFESEIFGEYVAREFFNVCYYLKNPAFQEEGEVRTIHNSRITEEDLEDISSLDTISECNRFSISQIDSINKNGIDVSYCDLGFENYILDNLIDEIVIGPRSKLSESEVLLMLSAQGFNIEDIIVRKSCASYR